MQIRIRENGNLVTEQEFRQLYPNTTFPAQITESILNDFGADVVFEGPQANGGEFWQFSMRQGVEQIKGKWYTKYVLGPVFETTSERDKYIAQKIAEIRATLWNSIKAIRDRKTQQGGYKVGDKWFHSDNFSRNQQLGLVLMGVNLPKGLKWKTMDGSFIDMTQTLAQQIFQAAAASDTAIFTYAETLKAKVDTNPNPSLVDINSGWPETFGNI